MGNLRKKGREDMGFWELVVLAAGLSMDAFAVSICKGLALQRVSWKECCIAGAWFGGFQALMPLLGYLLGTQFERFVTSVDHWIAFVLLGIIGGNMIREALSKDEDKLDGSLAFKTMLLLAIATSIDAPSASRSRSCPARASCPPWRSSARSPSSFPRPASGSATCSACATRARPSLPAA